MIIIDYKYKSNWIPSAFSLRDISYNKFEKEYIFQPYTFYKIKKVKVDLEQYEADIYLENIGKENILEKFIKKNKIIKYNEKKNIMEEIEEKEYSDNINKILEKQYPLLSLSTKLSYQDNQELINTEINNSQINPP